MKILFVALSANDKVRGVERYCIELLKELSKIKDLQITVLIGEWQGFYQTIFANSDINFEYADCGKGIASRHFFLFWKLRRLYHNYEVIHHSNTYPVWNSPSSKSLITIHDLAEFQMPKKYSFMQRFYRRIIVSMLLKKLRFIKTVSDFSKNEIEKKTKFGTHVFRVYNGVDHFTTEKVTKTNASDSRVILLFSVIEKTKGVKEFVEAFKIFHMENNDYKAVIIGKLGNAEDELPASDDDRFDYYGFLSDEILKEHLVRASCVVFASKYEGFGFPALEAFNYNDNIISSNCGSLGEITQQFATQVDPNDIEELSAAMKKVVSTRKNFTVEEKSLILDRFTWLSAAEETRAIYKIINDASHDS